MGVDRPDDDGCSSLHGGCGFSAETRGDGFARRTFVSGLVGNGQHRGGVGMATTVWMDGIGAFALLADRLVLQSGTLFRLFGDGVACLSPRVFG